MFAVSHIAAQQFVSNIENVPAEITDAIAIATSVNALPKKIKIEDRPSIRSMPYSRRFKSVSSHKTLNIVISASCRMSKKGNATYVSNIAFLLTRNA